MIPYDICLCLSYFGVFPGGATGKELAWQCKRHKRCEFDLWSGPSPGGGHGSPLQYFCLENPMVRDGPWPAIVHRVEKSWTLLKRLSMQVHPCCIISFFFFSLFLYFSASKLNYFILFYDWLGFQCLYIQCLLYLLMDI